MAETINDTIDGEWRDVGVEILNEFKARFGRTDFGANAERIRTLLKEIVTRLESTVPVAEGGAPAAKKAATDAAVVKRERSGDPKSVYRRKSRDRAQ